MSFNSIADTDFSTVERPKPIPAGEYLVAVNKLPTHTERDDGATVIVEFPMRVVAALPDTDTSDYEGDVRGKLLRHSVWIRPGDKEDGGMFKLKKFLEDTLGVGPLSGKGALPKALNDCINKECLATVIIKMNEDGDAFANIKSVRASD